MSGYVRKVCMLPIFYRNITCRPAANYKLHLAYYQSSLKNVVCYFSSSNKVNNKEISENDQISNLRAQEVEFEPSRAQDVFQNAVEEVSNPTFTDNDSMSKEDDKEHIAAYQCATNVHLNAVMQSMVPDPFTVKGKAPVHLNMPGGTWSRGQKYLAEHRTTIKDTDMQIQQKRECHTNSPTSQEGLTQRQKLKLIIKDYGSTVVVFHVGLSLTSLGIFYLAVSSGLDVAALLAKIGIENNSIAVGGSTFVVAYAVHKVFAPLRIFVTLSITPFIVRYLRGAGILKVPNKTG